MIILVTGASHTGKTLLAQQLMERYHIPYLSMDHIKMGLIRSKNTSLTVKDDNKLCEYLWPIIKEIIKTAIENKQHLIIEGCYILYPWKDDFSEEELSEIKDLCLIMSEEYIRENYEKIVAYENIIEKRKEVLDSSINDIILDNRFYLKQCIKYHCRYFLIQKEYELEKMIEMF